MKIKAVLFDCDGLMFNTEQISQDIWRKVASGYGTTIPQTLFDVITGAGKGVDLSEFYEQIPHFREILEEERKLRFDLNFWSSFQDDQIMKKGLFELFDYLKENGYATAICSSSKTPYIKTLLSTLSRELKFDLILGGEHVTKGKPDPEIYLIAAQQLGVEPQDCLVLEDSRQGIIAANRAGMHGCFIEDTIAFDSEIEANMEWKADDLTQVISLLKSM